MPCKAVFSHGGNNRSSVDNLTGTFSPLPIFSPGEKVPKIRQFFPRGKLSPRQFFPPGENSEGGKIAGYTGTYTGDWVIFQVKIITHIGGGH